MMRGSGSYDGEAGAGTVESTLTGVFPYAGVDLSSGGMHALLGHATLAVLAAPDDGLDGRLDVRAGYGFGALGDRFTAIPEVGLALDPE